MTVLNLTVFQPSLENYNIEALGVKWTLWPENIYVRAFGNRKLLLRMGLFEQQVKHHQYTQCFLQLLNYVAFILMPFCLFVFF